MIALQTVPIERGALPALFAMYPKTSVLRHEVCGGMVFAILPAEARMSVARGATLSADSLAQMRGVYVVTRYLVTDRQNEALCAVLGADEIGVAVAHVAPTRTVAVGQSRRDLLRDRARLRFAQLTHGAMSRHALARSAAALACWIGLAATAVWWTVRHG